MTRCLCIDERSSEVRSSSEFHEIRQAESLTVFCNPALVDRTRQDGTEDNETCSRSLTDWREALLVKAELCSRTTAAEGVCLNKNTMIVRYMSIEEKQRKDRI